MPYAKKLKQLCVQQSESFLSQLAITASRGQHSKRNKRNGLEAIWNCFSLIPSSCSVIGRCHVLLRMSDLTGIHNSFLFQQFILVFVQSKLDGISLEEV